MVHRLANITVGARPKPPFAVARLGFPSITSTQETPVQAIKTRCGRWHGTQRRRKSTATCRMRISTPPAARGPLALRAPWTTCTPATWGATLTSMNWGFPLLFLYSTVNLALVRSFALRSRSERAIRNRTSLETQRSSRKGASFICCCVYFRKDETAATPRFECRQEFHCVPQSTGRKLRAAHRAAASRARNAEI